MFYVFVTFYQVVSHMQVPTCYTGWGSTSLHFHSTFCVPLLPCRCIWTHSALLHRAFPLQRSYNGLSLLSEVESTSRETRSLDSCGTFTLTAFFSTAPRDFQLNSVAIQIRCALGDVFIDYSWVSTTKNDQSLSSLPANLLQEGGVLSASGTLQST